MDEKFGSEIEKNTLIIGANFHPFVRLIGLTWMDEKFGSEIEKNTLIIGANFRQNKHRR